MFISEERIVRLENKVVTLEQTAFETKLILNALQKQMNNLEIKIDKIEGKLDNLQKDVIEIKARQQIFKLTWENSKWFIGIGLSPIGFKLLDYTFHWGVVAYLWKALSTF